MYLKRNRRRKNGKIHEYWSIVESLRCAGGRTMQRHVLYLGEISDAQLAQWGKSIEAFDEPAKEQGRLKLFPAGCPLPDAKLEATSSISVRLRDFVLKRPRQWGACWLFTELWQQLKLDEFWRQRLGVSREGTRWESVLATLTAHRLIDPGSEWALHRHWFEHSAMADLLGGDASLAADDTLYRCLDRLLEHKKGLFAHLQARWRDLFGAKFEVLLYDLTSTYFESDPPENPTDKRRFGYSRTNAAIAYRWSSPWSSPRTVFRWPTRFSPAIRATRPPCAFFLKKIETQYGKAERIWVMDRGIPTEQVLEEMRASDPPVSYLVGTPKARLGQLEQELAAQPWRRPHGSGGQTFAEGKGTLRFGAKPRPGAQGTLHAQTPTQETMEATRGVEGDEKPQTRRAVAQARRGQKRGTGGMAFG